MVSINTWSKLITNKYKMCSSIVFQSIHSITPKDPVDISSYSFNNHLCFTNNSIGYCTLHINRQLTHGCVVNKSLKNPCSCISIFHCNTIQMLFSKPLQKSLCIRAFTTNLEGPCNCNTLSLDNISKILFVRTMSYRLVTDKVRH